MDVQTIIVGLIILAASLSAGRMLLGKIKSFSADKSCGAGCGCEPGSKKRDSFTQIGRS